MSVRTEPVIGAVIVPDSLDGLTTDLRWQTDRVRAGMFREWLPSIWGAWQDRLDVGAGAAGGAR